MSQRRIDQVTILGSRPASTVTISWDSRNALLGRLRQAGGAGEVIQAFEAVGTSAPVRLSKSARGWLLVIVEAWLSEESPTGSPKESSSYGTRCMTNERSGEVDDEP